MCDGRGNADEAPFYRAILLSVSVWLGGTWMLPVSASLRVTDGLILRA